MFTYRGSPSARRTGALSYYTVGSPKEWVRRAAAAIDEAAAALCREQWRLAPVRIVVPESRAAAARAHVARVRPRVDCSLPWS